MAEEEEMERRGAGVEGVQVLVSHSPPWGLGDTNRSGRHCGSRGLRRAVEGLGRPPALWLFGHVHECGGRSYRRGGITMVNAASISWPPRGVRPPVVVDLLVATGEVLGVRAFTGE